MSVGKCTCPRDEIPWHNNPECPQAKAASSFAEPDGSEATWWVYYLSDEGKTVYITAIPLPKKNAMGHCRAAQRYYRGRHVIQITETPPNAPGERPGQEARELKP